MNYDIAIIGAGPAGLSFAKSLSAANLKIALIEKQPKKTIENPAYDGREIALTHLSHAILDQLGILTFIPAKNLSKIKDAKVLDGTSPYALHFDHTKTEYDHLGYMASNQSIRRACYLAIENDPAIDFITEVEVKKITEGVTHNILTLSNGRNIKASLIVAADSRFSASRGMMGIATSMLDFGRTCIVCTLDTELAHDETAYEMFHYDRTLAVLPLNGKSVSAVITLDTKNSADVLSLTPEDFAVDVQERINQKFGKMKLSSKLFPYPLVATFANQFYAHRFALIGDAAVGMHPVTAHGFNLGLKGVRTLSDIITNGQYLGSDVGEKAGLQRYSQVHQRACRPIYLGTNALVRLYTNTSLPARLARRALLHLGNKIAPAQRMIVDQLTEAKAI